MKKQAEYIKRIEIKGLWGRKNIAWDLRPDVNILSGVNGIGKSTILNNSVRRLSDLEGGALSNGIHLGVSFTFYPEDATYIHFDVIRSFDRPLLSSGLLEKIGNQNVKTELDWQLYLLQRRYLDYQVNIGNRIIELLTSGKQMLVILLTVLVQDNQPCTLFMDEPEISLHVEWQQRLISLIRSLNPNVQIILTTHSPALIMNGWMDAVTEVSDITTL